MAMLAGNKRVVLGEMTAVKVPVMATVCMGLLRVKHEPVQVASVATGWASSTQWIRMGQLCTADQLW